MGDIDKSKDYFNKSKGHTTTDKMVIDDKGISFTYYILVLFLNVYKYRVNMKKQFLIYYLL